MLLPSGQVIPGLLPCAEEAEKRVVRIPCGTVVLLHIPIPIPTSPWAERPPLSCSTGTFLPEPWDSWGGQQRV